ncbi:ATP-binding protein [Soonwooa sp.]|uniref:ATP-binding protein n=1 Tax=Soonwooa sp. TaxID=1938592 RepID=UPI0028A58C6C|nr:ATP-binding protein [Soonwooa sp.]
MSTIIIKKLSLLNFKGLEKLTIDFDNNTNIFGDNGTGKTTVFDSFTWLLFGKDSQDRKDFEVKTLDQFNQAIPKIEHEVSAVLDVDGELVSLKRILKEKWTKIKGREETEFTGNETLYYWNDVPLSQKEYQNKVSQILDEAVFKMITSPAAFNNLKWQERRNVLVTIAGEVSDEELAKGNADYMTLLSQLTNKSLDEYKKQIAATIKKAKDDIKTIPTRIDEVNRSKPEPADETAINKQIEIKKALISNFENMIQDKAAANDSINEEKTKNQNEIFKLKSQLNTIKFEVTESAKLELKSDDSQSDVIKKQIQDKEKNELSPAKEKVQKLIKEKSELTSIITELETKIVGKRADWNTENGKVFTFSEDNSVCPCCNRPFDIADVEQKKSELQANFNTQKQSILAEINAEGKRLADKKTEHEKEIAVLDERIVNGQSFISKIEGEISSLKASILIENSENKPTQSLDVIVANKLTTHPEYNSIKDQISVLEKKEFKLPENNEELKIKKVGVQQEIDILVASLQANVTIKAADKRIEELEAEESKLAQEIAEIEKTQFVIESFTKLKVDAIEDKINQKFSFVKFKLFKTQINGGLDDCCEALINGVPYSNANTASQINAGIDIINTLCEYYQVNAPIFIDNRESVVKLVDTKSQIINLIVSEDDKKLRVN